MGLLSKIGKKLDNGSLFDSFAAAQATLAGDYGGAASIYARGKANRREEEKDRAKQEAIEAARKTAYQWAKGAGYGDVEAAALANDPETISAMIADRDKVRQGGAEGITLVTRDPTTGKNRTETTAGWHEGSYYGGSDGTRAPDVLRDTPKIVPIQPGGSFKAFGGASGRPIPIAELQGGNAAIPGMGPPSAAPMLGQPQPTAQPPDNVFRPGQVVRGFRFKGGDDADPANWEKVEGGAGPRGPSRFPY